MRLFITGSEGFVGKELVAQCRDKGMDIFTVDLSKGNGLMHRQLDIRSEEIAPIIPDDVDAIVHLAGLTTNADCKGRPYECFEANVMATLKLISAAENKKVKQFIFASSEWVYGEDRENKLKDENSVIDVMALVSEYAFSKIVSETNLKQKFQQGFCPVTILRFGIIYGSRTHGWSAVESIFNAVSTKNEVKVGALNTARCFIHVSDIARGIIKAIGLDGFNILNLVGNRLITLSDCIAASEKILNKKTIVFETDPQNISIRHISNEKAKRTLHWEPEVNLETGLAKLGHFLSEKEIE